MTSGDDYRKKAAEFRAKARLESKPEARAEWEALALSYVRLAKQADRNSLADTVYEPPPRQADAQQQVQQQPQSKLRPEQ